MKPYLRQLMVVIVYALCAVVGLYFAKLNSSVSPIWPASGFAIAAVVLWGWKTIPAIWVGALLANLTTGSPLGAVLLISCGNALEAFVGSAIYQRISRFKHPLENQKKTISILCAAAISPLFSATTGIFALIWLGDLDGQNSLGLWITWWSGDLVGTLTVLPLLSLFKTWRAHDFQSQRFRPFLLVAAAYLLLIVGVLFLPLNDLVLILVFPILLMSMLNLNPLQANFLGFLYCYAIVILTLLGFGPFVSRTGIENLTHLQTYIGAVMVTALVLNGLKRVKPIRYPALVYLLCWTITTVVYIGFDRFDHHNQDAKFEESINKFIHVVSDRFEVYSSALTAGVALHNASENVSSKEWAIFFKALNLENKFPGAVGFGVALPVPSRELKQFVRIQKNENHKDFKVTTVPGVEGIRVTADKNENHYVVTNIEPMLPNQAALGLDLGSEEHRRAAADLARDTGDVTITQEITLVQDPRRRLGFLLFQPIYRVGVDLSNLEQRRTAFLGWVYAAFVWEEFFKGLALELEEIPLDLKFFSANNKTIFFESKRDDSQSYSITRPITLAHGQFGCHFRPSSRVMNLHNLTMALILLVGAMVSLFFAGYISILQSVSLRAQFIADFKTKELNESTQRLREQREQFSLAVEGSNDGIWDWNLVSNKVYYSPRWKSMLGYEDHELNGDFETWKSLHHPEDLENSLIALEQYLKGEKLKFSLEKRLRHKDGSYRWILARGLALRGPDGKPYRMAGSHTDITEQKNAQKSLIEAKEIAESATRAKALFLANMSHEIRTPMNGIIGTTALLMHSTHEPQQIEKLKIIESCCHSLLEIVNDVLDFSKLEADKLELEISRFDLKSTVQEIVEIFKPNIEKKGLKIDYKQATDLPALVHTDMTRFRQILSNLISNAIKFTQQGAIEISAKVLISDEQKKWIEFRVKDSGVGIPKSVLPRLFNSFTQADSSTTRRFGGTGLGLAISKRLCEKLGGSICVESVVNAGSTFIFSFLDQPEAAKAFSEELSVQHQIDGSFASQYPLSILVADDILTNRIVAKGLLENLGYKPEFVEDGQEVLLALKQKNFDLILMDCHMPNLDGFEATKMILSDPSIHPKPRILAVSASHMKEDVEQCFAVGMNGFVGKPILVKNLAAALAQSFDHIKRNQDEAKVLPFKVGQKHPELAVTSFNREELLQNFSAIESLIVEAVESLLSSLPKLIEDLEAAVTTQDAHLLKKSGHALKGSLANFGALKSKHLAQKLEDLGLMGSLTGAKTYLDTLKSELEILSRELQILTSELANSSKTKAA